MNAAVVGLGKIGLPLAAQIASRGIPTIGCDIDQEVIDSVNAGRAPFPGEEGLAEILPGLIADRLLRATTDTSAAVSESGVTIIVVPLLVNEARRPAFGAIDSATRDVGNGLSRDHLVIYETTLPVGTTRNRFGALLAKTSGLNLGTDFHLAFSPERVYSGRIFADLRRYPKLIGGIDDASSRAAASFYEKALEFDPRPDLDRANGVWDLGSAEAAELAKLAETTYRDVNIALANEFGAHAEDLGIDIGTVIDAANSQPFSHIHRPGLVGGHCIPVYPYFYLAGHPSARLPATGREVNDSVATRVVERLEEAAGGLRDRVVAVLGASYRGGVKETAFSGVFGLELEVRRRGGIPRVHDPMYGADELAGLGLEPFNLGEDCHAAIVQADHPEYATLTTADIPGCVAVFDVRGALPVEFEASMTVLRLGNGSESA